jgi:hypothetical protein
MFGLFTPDTEAQSRKLDHEFLYVHIRVAQIESKKNAYYWRPIFARKDAYKTGVSALSPKPQSSEMPSHHKTRVGREATQFVSAMCVTMHKRARALAALLVLLFLFSVANCQQCTPFKSKTGYEGDGADGHPKFVDIKIDLNETCKTYRLYTVTYATHLTRPDFCIMAVSATSYGFPLNVLGTNRQQRFKENGLLDKLWALQEFVDALPVHSDIIVAFVDAYDTIFNGSPKALARRLVVSGQNIVFASERGCCSNKFFMRKSQNDCDKHWPLPDVKTATPHLNTGVFVGYRIELGDLLRLSVAEYTATIASLRPGEVDPYKRGTDQTLICQLYSYGGYENVTTPEKMSAIRRKLGMVIDFENVLFMCMYGADLSDEIKYTTRGRVAVIGTNRCQHLAPRFAESCFGVQRKWSHPVVLHFNGAGNLKTVPLREVAMTVSLPDKRSMEEIWDAHMWVMGGNEVTVGGVCRDLPGDCGRRPVMACFGQALGQK